MRGKEESADYRYFNDPDLLPVFLSDELLERAKNIPEMPDFKIKRYIETLGIKESYAKVLVQDIDMVPIF